MRIVVHNNHFQDESQVHEVKARTVKARTPMFCG